MEVKKTETVVKYTIELSAVEMGELSNDIHWAVVALERECSYGSSERLNKVWDKLQASK